MERSPIQLSNEFRRGRWWDDLQLEVTAVGLGVSVPVYDATNFGWIFSDNPPNNRRLQYIGEMPHRWAIGSPIEIHIHWTLSEDAGAANEDVKWDIYYRVYQTGDTIPAFTGPVETLVDVSGYGLMEAIYTDLAVPSMAGITQTSSIIEIRLARDTDDAADDHPHDALMKHLDIHYQIDQPGSFGEIEKWG